MWPGPQELDSNSNLVVLVTIGDDDRSCPPRDCWGVPLFDARPMARNPAHKGWFKRISGWDDRCFQHYPFALREQHARPR